MQEMDDTSRPFALVLALESGSLIGVRFVDEKREYRLLGSEKLLHWMAGDQNTIRGVSAPRSSVNTRVSTVS